MKAFWLLLALTLSLGAKDNFIFDYRNDPLMIERLERIEREIGELKASVITLRQDQAKSAKPAASSAVLSAQIKKLETAIANQKKAIDRLGKAQNNTPSAPVQSNGNTAQLIAQLENSLADLRASVAGKSELAPLAMQIDLLNEKILSLELALRENYAGIQDGPAWLPFERQLGTTKAHVEYFVMGLLILLALLFLMLIVALGRGKRAEAKIAQLVKLYQSSNKKSDERK